MINENLTEQVQNPGLAANSLRQLGTALLQYIPNHEHTLPPMQDSQTAKAALSSYLPAPQVFAHAESGREYLPNPALSNQPMAAFPFPMQTVAFYEDVQEDSSSRLVLFLDGHVETVKSGQWNALRATTKPPL